jgi:hypothetical protein
MRRVAQVSDRRRFPCRVPDSPRASAADSSRHVVPARIPSHAGRGEIRYAGKRIGGSGACGDAGLSPSMPRASIECVFRWHRRSSFEPRRVAHGSDAGAIAKSMPDEFEALSPDLRCFAPRVMGYPTRAGGNFADSSWRMPPTRSVSRRGGTRRPPRESSPRESVKRRALRRGRRRRASNSMRASPRTTSDPARGFLRLRFAGGGLSARSHHDVRRATTLRNSPRDVIRQYRMTARPTMSPARSRASADWISSNRMTSIV